ncbi:MAG: putative Ig domain-containing protein [Steroidobacteraceae bacterium]
MVQQKNTWETAVRAIAVTASLATAIGMGPAAQAATITCRPGLPRNLQRHCKPPPPPRNVAPSISGSPATKVMTGETYAFRPTASDVDGNRLTFKIVNKPAWASFSPSTGRLSGSPTTSSVGEYIEIRIKVTDGAATRSLAPFSIVVRQANRAPRIAGTPPTAAREGQAYEFRAAASDPDDDRLTFSISNRPAWATFESSTGRLSGTPRIGTVGSYANVTIRVSDGRKTVSLPAFAINVEQAAMGSATLSWQAPSTRLDGSPLTDLAGYRIRYGTAPDSFPNIVQIANAGVTTHVVDNLPRGTYYFVATAYDTAGLESEFSGSVSKTID